MGDGLDGTGDAWGRRRRVAPRNCGDAWAHGGGHGERALVAALILTNEEQPSCRHLSLAGPRPYLVDSPCWAFLYVSLEYLFL